MAARSPARCRSGLRRAGLAQRVGGAVELALAVIGPADHRPHRPVRILATGQWRPESKVVDRPVCIGNWCPANYGRSFAGTVR
jgi:membrane peptidoglycan carboxypeptidase